MSKHKLLIDEYNEYLKEYPAKDIKKRNNAFFQYAKETFDEYKEKSDNSLRLILVHAGVFVASNPRPEKKNRVTKKELLRRLNNYCDNKLTSIDKLNITDLELLLAAMERSTTKKK